MIYVSSDWHGYSPEKIKALLARASFGDGDFLYVLGDVIDRGDFGIELIKWLMSEPNMRLILGNHEGLLISNAWVFSRITDDSLDELDNAKIRAMGMWMRDGGDPTMKALAKESEEVRADILEYLKCECPLYEQISVGGREILLVHGGLGNYSHDKMIEDYEIDELLWERPLLTTRYSDEFLTIVGHTPTCVFGKEYEGRIIKTETFINIDTGASCGYSPSLLRLDDMKEFYID